MTNRKFKFRAKTIRLPWTPHSRIFFGVEDDVEDPESYTVTIGLKSCNWKAVCKGPGSCLTTYACRTHNPLRLEKRSTVA